MTPSELKTLLDDALKQLKTPSEIASVTKTKSRLSETIRDFQKGIDNALDKNKLLWIGVVGQMKAGKSSFLNSLLFNGETILPIAATPMTAGLTTLEYTDSHNHMEICYYSNEDWSIIKEEADTYGKLLYTLLDERPELRGNKKTIEREMKKRATSSQISSAELVEMLTPEASEKIGSEPFTIDFQDVRELQEHLTDLVGANGRFTSVVSMLKIYLNHERLKGLKIVDTPGVNDPVTSREVITHQFLHKCHGVFMLSRADHAFGNSDKTFMDQRLSAVGINAILLIGSQFDLVLNNPQYEGKRLSDAVSEATRSLSSSFEKSRKLLLPETSKAICSVIFSAGMAQSVYTKLKTTNYDVHSANLNRFEENFWSNLCEQYPNDFSTPEEIEKSLTLLANFSAIKKVMNDNFLKRKNEIRRKKYTAYLTEQSKLLKAVLDKAIRSVKDELDFFNSSSVDKLKSEIEALKDSTESMVKPLQICIDKRAKSLQTDWTSIEQRQLSKSGVKVECGCLPTSSNTVYYTRTSTSFLKRTRSSYVYVDVINRESAKERQRSAMESYRQYVDEKWDDIINQFITGMLKEMVEKLQALNPVLAGSSMLLSNIVRDIFEVKLEDFKVLILSDILSNSISGMNEFVNKTDLTSFNTSLGRMSENDADQKIKQQASEKREAARKGLQTRDDEFMRRINDSANSSIKQIVQILKEFRSDISENLNEATEKILAEKTKMFSNKQKTIDELNQCINCLETIKRNING